MIKTILLAVALVAVVQVEASREALDNELELIERHQNYVREVLTEWRNLKDCKNPKNAWPTCRDPPLQTSLLAELVMMSYDAVFTPVVETIEQLKGGKLPLIGYKKILAKAYAQAVEEGLKHKEKLLERSEQLLSFQIMVVPDLEKFSWFAMNRYLKFST